jgi:hypothetical protein
METNKMYTEFFEKGYKDAEMLYKAKIERIREKVINVLPDQIDRNDILLAIDNEML